MECREELRLQGMSYPRSCELCGPQACKRTSFARVKELESRIAALEAEKAEYEREKLKRESQEPVAFRWLGPGKGWRAVYAAPPAPHVDWLANVIRRSDPRMTMTSDELAEKIADAINGRAK